MNVVVARRTANEMAAASYYRKSLEQLAPRHEFGFVSRKRRRMTGLHAGRYIAKYLSEGTGKLGIGDLAARDDAPRTIALVNRKLTSLTGSTMREARERRVRWNLASRLAPLHADGCSIDEARELRAKLEFHRRMPGDPRSFRRRGPPPPDDPEPWNWDPRRMVPHYSWRPRVEDETRNQALARRQWEAHHQARWLILAMAKLGLQPEPLD